MISTLTLPGTFWFYSGVSLIGCLILYFTLPETEGRTLMEIQDHFAGIKKLPKRMPSKKDSEIPTVKIDLNNWQSNEIFEKHLQERNVSRQTSSKESNQNQFCPRHHHMGVKKNKESNQKSPELKISRIGSMVENTKL